MSSPTAHNTTSPSDAAVFSSSDPVGGGGGGDRPAVTARLKKDGTSVSDPSAPTTPPHIAPPELWGRVLDFMAYGDVRTALGVGKMFANDAVRYVRVLNFTKGYQLDGPSARRFASVAEVNCLCLISGEQWNTVLCKDTAIGLVPLLTAFPRMKEVRLGGLVAKDTGNGQTQLVRRRYDSRSCSSPANCKDLAKVLCQSFLGAFKTRMLSPSLDSRGDIADLFDKSNVCLPGNGEEDPESPPPRNGEGRGPVNHDLERVMAEVHANAERYNARMDAFDRLHHS